MDALLVMHRCDDDVAVAVASIEPGRWGVRALDDPGFTAQVDVVEAIPLGHKVSVRRLADDCRLTEYGQPIGRLMQDVVPGTHIHTHNLASLRWPSPARRDSAC